MIVTVRLCSASGFLDLVACKVHECRAQCHCPHFCLSCTKSYQSRNQRFVQVGNQKEVFMFVVSRPKEKITALKKLISEKSFYVGSETLKKSNL